MSASVADQLSKLADLFSRGLLSPDEFAEAKRTVLSSTAPQTTICPPSTTNHSAANSISTPYSAAPTDVASLFQPSHTAEFETVFKHLHKILNNLIQCPNEPKYRTLRLGNETLKRELWALRPPSDAADDEEPHIVELASSSAGCSAAELFLGHVGFQREKQVGKSGEEEDVLIWKGGATNSPSSSGYVAIQNGLEQVLWWQKQHHDALRRYQDFATFRHGVALQIRLEKLAAAAACGEGEAHCVRAMMADAADMDDAMFSTLEALKTVERILSNIASNASEMRYRALRLSNKMVHTALVRHRGGLELLILSGFVIRDHETSSAAPEVILEGESAEVLPRVTEGLAMVARLRASLVAERERQRAADREIAVEASRKLMAQELQRERRKLQPQSTLPQQPSSQQRLSIEDALKHLLGRAD